MKKLRLFMLLALISMLTLLALVGCENEDRVASISFKDHDPNTAIEMEVGEFDYHAYTVAVVYESGSTEEIALTEEMFTEAELFKLYQVGEHDITVSYSGSQYTFKVSVKRNTFGKLTFPENNVFTYNGETHTVEVDGEIPANAVVTYIGGNSFVNAGTYDVTAVVSCEGYVTQRLSTTVTIVQAKYDMSGVRFEDKEVVYNETPHSITISGTIPDGVPSPTYTINGKAGSSATDVGEYTVRATFSNNDPNYEAIPEMEATLKITPAEYSVEGVEIVFQGEGGNVISNATKVYDGKSITFDLNDYGKLSNKITASFAVYDKDGNIISTSNKTTNILEVGIYTVKVEFTMEDGKNYKPIAPIERTFEVLKAEYPPLQNIQFTATQSSYDGKAHSIVIVGELPAGVTVSYEYYKDGKLLVDGEDKPVQSVVGVGRYTVKAIFTHTDKNRDEIPSLSAVLNITAVEFAVSDLSVVLNGTDVYDGTEKTVSVMGVLPEEINATVMYYFGGDLLKNADGSYVTSVIEPGDYYVYVQFVSTSDNYVINSVLEYAFTIEKAVIDLDGIAYDGAESYVYNGGHQGPSIQNGTVPDKVRVTEQLFRVDGNGRRTAVGYAEDVGSYVKVFTITPADPTRYQLKVSGVTEMAFEIVCQPLDVSGINISSNRFVYNGSGQAPELVGIHELVNVDSSLLYVHNEIRPIEQAINAGNYRLEVALSPKSSNYRLSADELVFTFVIDPAVIDVSNLEFDSDVFDYDGQPHLPTLVDVPEHVSMIGDLYILNNINDDEDHVEEAVKAGKYRYYVRLGAESLNYTLSGNREYIIDFEIKVDLIIIADFSTLPSVIEITYDERFSDGYDYKEDDPLLAQAIINAILGENSNLAECRVGKIKNVETGVFLSQTAPILKNTEYEVKIQLNIKPESDNTYKYGFFYRDGYLVSANEIFVCVKLV